MNGGAAAQGAERLPGEAALAVLRSIVAACEADGPIPALGGGELRSRLPCGEGCDVDTVGEAAGEGECVARGGETTGTASQRKVKHRVQEAALVAHMAAVGLVGPVRRRLLRRRAAGG